MSRRAPLLFALCALLAASLATADSAEAAKKGRKKKAKTARAHSSAPAPAAPKPAADEGPSFDREAAAMALSSVDLTKCRATNAERGDGHVLITFAPDGAASSVNIDKGPWTGTPIAKCMAAQFKKAKIPAFSGEAVTVGKTFRFE